MKIRSRPLNVDVCSTVIRNNVVRERFVTDFYVMGLILKSFSK
jgi:hypothetical protein